MKAGIKIFTWLTMAAITVGPAAARSFRVNQIPNGSLISCSACHVNPGGGGVRNAFGQTVERSFLSGGNVVWSPLLASLDADGDGIPNGVELQDPYGQWQTGQPNPGNSSLVTQPGSSTSNAGRTVTVDFTGMDPHIGQSLYIRAINQATNHEVSRSSVGSITSGSFDVELPGLWNGGSYWIDFFADVNGNGMYDAPPTDHAWRTEANAISGNTTVNFAHNTNFTDIPWVYMLTLSATGMTPHNGNLFELRVVDTATDREVGRARIEVISTSNFMVYVPGLEAGHSYRADFYADLNRNGVYDAPPTDHAWSIDFTATTGDVALNFAHNTTFTDVMWEYLFQINLLNMTPHLNDMFELRVVDQSNSTEIGRTGTPGLALADFTLSVPGITRQANYRADFYADLNGNGMYDAPPTDHAWRELFSNTTGNVVVNFEHNTNFTDIQWPIPNAADPAPRTMMPEAYSLKQNYPNPFNPTTQLVYDLADAGLVRLTVYNVMGQQVAELVNRTMPAGHHELTFDGSGLASGLYLYRLEVNGFADEKKMVLMK
ncbi:MAG: T9SS type A sorting domain-containing protein [Calditrichota bacterium]